MPHSHASPKVTFWQWLAIGVVTLAYTWCYYQAMLAGPLRLNDDMVQHYLWLFVDHFDLDWKDTFYADASAAIQPRGFYWLLWGLGRFVDPLTISRGGPFLISLLTVGFGVALLRRYTHLFIAVAGSLLAVHLGFHSSVGFVARSFLMPLLLAFGYYLLRQDQPWGVAFTTVASALFYPPALLINGGIFACWKLAELCVWGWTSGRGRRVPADDNKAGWGAAPFRHWPVYLLGFGLALLVVWWHAERVAMHPSLGGYLERVKLISWPEFHSGGRVGIYTAVKGDVASLIKYLFQANFHSPFGAWFAYAVVALAGVVTIKYRKSSGALGAWLLLMAVAAGIFYVVARHWFPLLFLPDRYLVYPWRLWTPMVLTLLLAAGWRYWPRWWTAALLAAALLGYGYYRQTPAELPYSNEEGREELFATLRALPEEALIALPPALASQVPVFCHRNVFISHESAHALYFKNYHEYVMPRFHDFVEAYTLTGDQLPAVVAFMDKWGIDYLLVDRNQLQAGWLRTFEPFQRQFKEKWTDAGSENLTLLNVPDEAGQLIQQRLHLLSREDITRLSLQ